MRDMLGEQDLTFGSRLRRLRQGLGLTQEELAVRAGLSPRAISALERGERQRPYPHTVRTLADALGLSEEERASLMATLPRSGGATAPPTLPTPQEVNLPVPPTPLVGRERELDEIRTFLREVRMLTFTGLGGVGKTRLALEAARGAAEDFPDGVAFVALASLADPALVVPTIVRSLGLREAEGQSPHEALSAYLQKKRLLLILDNFEHLMEAAPEVSELLGSCPDLTVLTTSRAPLRLRGEREYPVPPLEVPDPSRVPEVEEMIGVPAARLFVERAKEVSPTFKLTEANAASVAANCWRLEGLPLALELAAAKARFLGPVELLAHLDRTLEAGAARDLPVRQRTMRATMNWSHELLHEPEKELCRRLSVFSGGFTLEAAEAVGAEPGASGAVADEEVFLLLGNLVEQSLVVAEPGEDEDTRYRMLEPVRQYAQELLEESGEQEEVRRGHAEYYPALAERARPELHGPRQAQWLDTLSSEHDNVRAAMTWLLERGKPKEAARIGWGIYEFWFRRGYTGEGLRWMERVLAEEGALPDLARSQAQVVAAILSFLRGEPDRAAAAATESVAASRAAGDPETLAHALGMQGLATLSRGDLDTAEAVLPESLRLYRELGDPHSVASGLYGLAHLALARGDGDEAMRLIGEGEALSREVGNLAMLATCLGTQAISTRIEGDDARTAELLRESVEIAGMLRDDYNFVFCATGLAGVAAREGRAERAARLFGVSDALSEKTGAGVAWSTLRSLNRRDLATTHEMLDPETFEKVWAEGRAMTLEQAVTYALEDDYPAPT